MKWPTCMRGLLALGLVAACCGAVRADGRAGAVEFSDGHKVTGGVSLTPGKELKLYTDVSQVSLSMDEVKEIRFKPEKEEMWEGFYFPDAGQTTQVKTGEVYPIRYLKTEITLADGKLLQGHLYTTVFYVEGDDTTQKVVVMAKQTGPNGTKLAELIYPTVIRFDAVSSAAGFSQIDLTQASLPDMKPPVIVRRPDLALLPVQPIEGKSIWTIPVANAAGQILFSVQADDGIHVAWPDGEPNPDMKQAADTGLKNMQDFYDNRATIAYITDADAGDIFTLCMLKRLGKSVAGDGSAFPENIVPYSLVILRWKYDPDQKKATLLNRALLFIGRQDATHPLPTILKQPALLSDISGNKQN
jgi:hypothetical protein